MAVQRSVPRNRRRASRTSQHGEHLMASPSASPSTLKRARQLELYRRAIRTLPGGADSNFRTWGEDTVYVDRGKGGRVWDIDGNEYVDLRMGYGPVILGHGDDRVDDYVNERMRRVFSFSLTSEDEVQAMELLCELTGWVDMARMTVSGTEATMHAMRVARAYTGRNKIVKFEGQYHGVHDYALISVTPNDMSELGEAEHPVRLAWGRGILPQPGFHEAMRALTQEFGILLIFDEVKTGFRFAKGGAAEYFGVTPDLATFAKAMGNGYPAAAFGGRDEVMSVLPDKVSHGGTYAGNRVAAAAAVKTLSIIRDTDALATVHETGRRIQAGLTETLDRKGQPYVFTGHPSMFGIMFTETAPSEYRDWANSDHALYDSIAVAMHARGAMPEPDSREPWFICEAHAKDDSVDRVISTFGDALAAALDARARGMEIHGPEGAQAHPTAG